jgi:di/tricarboxylate transporter
MLFALSWIIIGLVAAVWMSYLDEDDITLSHIYMAAIGPILFLFILSVLAQRRSDKVVFKTPWSKQ